MRGDQDRRGTIGSAASHIGDSDISLIGVSAKEKRGGPCSWLVTGDMSVLVNRRKDVFVFVIGKLPCSFLPGELARFDNSQNVEMHSLAGSG